MSYCEKLNKEDHSTSHAQFAIRHVRTAAKKNFKITRNILVSFLCFNKLVL